MKILIADDEKPARDRLRRLVSKVSGYELVGDAKTGMEALQQTAQYDPDIVLLDIRMPGMDGLEAARIIAQNENPPAIIFVTAFSDHALEAFEIHAVDYLLKPVKLEKLQLALKACSRLNRSQIQEQIDQVEISEQRKHICARVRGNLVLVALEDIYYFRAEQKYVTVRHTGGELLIEEPLKVLETEFAESFIRIHRNALVRLDKVGGMKNNPDGHQIFFTDTEEKLEVSRRHLSGVRKILKNL